MTLQDFTPDHRHAPSLGIHPSVLSPAAIDRDLSKLADLFEALAHGTSGSPSKNLRDLLELVTASETIGALHALSLAALAISILVFGAFPAAVLLFFFALPFVPAAALCAWRTVDSVQSKHLLAAAFWTFWTSFHLAVLITCVVAGFRRWPAL